LSGSAPFWHEAFGKQADALVDAFAAHRTSLQARLSPRAFIYPLTAPLPR
jgi:hypothetical protein